MNTKSLLIVERDREVAGVMTQHFENVGFEVDSSADGLDAIMKIRADRPDVVVMGLTTPRLGGVDALRLLRRWHPELSVVLTDSERLPAGPPDQRWRSIDRLVTLAAAQSGSGAPGAPTREPLGHPTHAESADRSRILVVDDLEDIRELLRDVLEAEGYTVDVAADATTAIAKAASDRPQVVLLDISMPGLSGISALQQLRARDPRVGVIMITGNGDDGIARQTLALGAFDYVPKPIDFDYLRGSVRTLLLMRTLVPQES